MATIRFFAAAKAATGVSSCELAAVTVQDAISQLEIQFPKLTTVLTKCGYLLNEVACHDLSTKLNPQDTLDVLPPFAGG